MPPRYDDDARPLKSQQIADDLRRGIRAGTWAHGQRLPTEQQLVDRSGFSVNTVRRALDVLVAEGLVERRQGSGTFVLGRTAPTTRERYTVGVLLPDTRLYYPRVLQGIESALSSQRAGLHLATYGYDADREDDCIEQLLTAGVSGLLLVPTLVALDDPSRRLNALLDLPVPVVLLERSLSDLGPADRSEHVCSDHAAGAYDAVLHLHHLGHRKVALLLRGRSATGLGVRAGYERAVADLGLTIGLDKQWSSEEWEHSSADVMLAQTREWGATAVLVFGDREASLLLGALARTGGRVPDDLAIVSYDDEIADIAQVPLTAVAPPKHRIGRMAAEALLQRLREGDACPLHQIRVRPRLVIRESCGARRDVVART